MRRQIAVLWLALVLCLAGPARPCLAQDAAPDIPLLNQKAQSGDTSAMISLGEAYLDGNGIPRNLDAAIGWFATAAQANDIQAVYLLSFALRERGKPGDLDQALRYGTVALALARKQPGSAFVEANIQSQLGFTYERLGRFEEAVEAYASARRIFERLLGKSHPQVAGAYMNLASGLAGAGRREESLAANETALGLFVKLTGSDSQIVAELYENRGIGLISLARYSEALEALDKAMAIHAQHGGPDALGVANVLKTKSRAYSLLTRHREAAEAAKSALAIYARTPPDQRTLAATHGMLGLAYQGLARYEEARAQYLQAVDILERTYGTSIVEMIHPLTNLGNVDDDLEKYDDALQNYRKALAIIRNTYGPDHADAATMLGRLGNTSRKLNRYDAALSYGLEALLIQGTAANPDIDNQRYTFRMLARTLAAKGSKNAALVFAKQAVNAHQALRSFNSGLSSEFRTALSESFQPSYNLLTQLLLSDGQFAEAQFASGLLKQEELYEFTRSDSGRSRDAQDIEPGVIRLTKAEQALWDSLKGLMAPEHQLAAELRTVMAAREKTGELASADQDRLRDLTERRDAAVQTFITKSIELVNRSELEKRSLQQQALEFGPSYTERLQADFRIMGPDVVMLQAISLDDSFHFFVSAPGRETIHREVPITRAALADQVFAAVLAVENRGDDAIEKLAGLYELLLKPIRPYLDAAVSHDDAEAPVLLLDLSGFLRYVPYAALYDGKRFLVEDFALTLYNPAARTKFAPMRRGRIKGAGFGVTREHPGFSALPGVGHELEAVFDIVDGAPALDEGFNEATLAKALARRPKILHIASHFRFRPGNETKSYLLLGNGSRLSLDRLRMQKKFRFQGVDLVTLSACETARGGGAEGEEIESFGALAQSNGASAVMSTLWQIADNSTAQLMTGFYDGLISRDLDKARALRQAQLFMIRGGGPQAVALQSTRSMSIVEDRPSPADLPPTYHPYYWAAFILMGNWM